MKTHAKIISLKAGSCTIQLGHYTQNKDQTLDWVSDGELDILPIHNSHFELIDALLLMKWGNQAAELEIQRGLIVGATVYKPTPTSTGV